MVVNLTSLSPSTVDATLDEFRRDASGKALEDTSQTLQQTVDLIKSQNVTTKGTILADAVVSSDADQATVLIVSGWTMNNSQPVVQTFRWKVTVSRIDGQMKLTGYEWVT
jgi:Mce-associated membrane protein